MYILALTNNKGTMSIVWRDDTIGDDSIGSYNNGNMGVKCNEARNNMKQWGLDSVMYIYVTASGKGGKGALSKAGKGGKGSKSYQMYSGECLCFLWESLEGWNEQKYEEMCRF